MNEKVSSLGGTDSHFTNCNGLFDEDHYTSAYDLADSAGNIICGLYQHTVECLFHRHGLSCINSPKSGSDEDYVWIASKNQLYKGKPYEYQYLLGSKTGYVSQSRQTLVSAAEKNGMKLVCVVFMDETPYQFEDTITLFQYGFEPPR